MIQLDFIQLVKVATKIFPTLKANESTVYLDGKILFQSTEPKCVEAFIFGLINGKSLK